MFKLINNRSKKKNKINELDLREKMNVIFSIHFITYTHHLKDKINSVRFCIWWFFFCYILCWIVVCLLYFFFCHHQQSTFRQIGWFSHQSHLFIMEKKRLKLKPKKSIIDSGYNIFPFYPLNLIKVTEFFLHSFIHWLYSCYHHHHW